MRGRWRAALYRHPVVVGVVALGLISAGDAVNLASASGAQGNVIQVLSASSYGFDGPLGVSSDGTYVWVANQEASSVTEFSASTGALVQDISGAKSGVTVPFGISSDGTHVW